MRVLITGNGGDIGSWKIRGEQLGAAMGATVKPMATVDDCAAHDVIVVVKRPAPVIQNILKSGKPWVFDIVDGWPQPCNWNRDEACAWLRELLKTYKPRGVVFGTEQMRADVKATGELSIVRVPGALSIGYPLNSLVLPHHSWQKYCDHTPEIRQEVRVVGYEGNVDYLGKWYKIVKRECLKRGWRLAINDDMRQADIGLALRDGGGYPARWWKPGTKLSNLHAIGIPAICSLEAGYQSVASGSETWVENAEQLQKAFDDLADYDLRCLIREAMRFSVVHVEHVAMLYTRWLNNVV